MRPEQLAEVGCRGQTLVEYALLLLLVAVATVAGLGLFGSSISGLFGQVTGSF